MIMLAREMELASRAVKIAYQFLRLCAFEREVEQPAQLHRFFEPPLAGIEIARLKISARKVAVGKRLLRKWNARGLPFDQLREPIARAREIACESIRQPDVVRNYPS